MLTPMPYDYSINNTSKQLVTVPYPSSIIIIIIINQASGKSIQLIIVDGLFSHITILIMFLHLVTRNESLPQPNTHTSGNCEHVRLRCPS